MFLSEPLKKLWAILDPQEKKKFFKMTFLSLLVSFLEIITALWVIFLVRVLMSPESIAELIQKYFNWNLNSYQILVFLSVAYGVFYSLKSFVLLGQVYYQNSAINWMLIRSENRLLKRYVGMDYGTFLLKSPSYHGSLFADLKVVFLSAVISICGVIAEGTVLASLVIFLFFISPLVSFLIIGVGGVIAFCLRKFLFPFLQKMSQIQQEANRNSQKHLFQLFQGFKEVVLSGRENRFINLRISDFSKSASKSVSQMTAQEAPRLVLEVLFICIFVGSICLLCFQKASFQAIMSILGGYLYVGFRFLPSINRIITFMSRFHAAIPYIERVYDDHKKEIKEAAYSLEKDLEFHDLIEFKNISFSYPANNRIILNNVNFIIKKGEVLGIVGETGSGKSTLMDLMLGLLRPEQGEIKIDGQFSVFSRFWHAKVGYVPQSLYLTDDTIAANVAFGEDTIDYERVEKCLQDAQIGALIAKLPEGIHTHVGERGVRLSGGERQRISIARALYRSPEVLIFDEATSALDHETESRVMDTVYSVAQGRTLIMVAHRLSTLQKCHRVIRVENGQVYEVQL